MKKTVTTSVTLTWTTELESAWYQGEDPVVGERRLLQGDDYLLESIISHMNIGAAEVVSVTVQESCDT